MANWLHLEIPFLISAKANGDIAVVAVTVIVVVALTFRYIARRR